MNSNRQRFWMLADGAQWQRQGDPATLRWDASRRTLRLAGFRALPEPDGGVDIAATAASRLALPRGAVDPFGCRAAWDGAAGVVRAATPGLPDDVTVAQLTAGADVTDLAMGSDGILYLAVGGKVALHDPRERWETPAVGHTAVKAWRLAPRHDGGVWVLDRVHRRLGTLQGQPLPHRPPVAYAPETWRPVDEEPAPPRLAPVFDLALETGEVPVGIASHGSTGRVALLLWDTDGAARIRLLAQQPDGSLTGLEPPLALLRAPGEPLLGAYSLAWIADDRLAVLAPGFSEAPTFELPQAEEDGGVHSLLPAGDLYPLRDHDGGPFFNGPSLPVLYPLAAAAAPGETAPGAPLNRLSFPSFASSGIADGELLDGGTAGTEWHRLYVEACLPVRCGVRVLLAASDEDNATPEWHEHRFGAVSGGSGESGSGAPRGAWVPLPSELPFHDGLLPCARENGRAGLFTCLVQRAGRRVTALTGRYLRVRVELLGDGRSSPELAALRAWSARFSYADHYLPELYREEVLGADGDDQGQATPADFLERFLDNFEGVLTPLEDRIAASYLLTDARTVPDDALEWLASWVGLAFEPGFPPERRRRLLQATPELYRRRGTLGGLQQALDIATAGGVAGGEVVVLEEFRLRRTFATILGVDLADEADPLLGGLTASGNSYVGDTLFLGDESKREFLALFDAGLPLSPAEQRAVDLFFERLAHRATVLVHQDVEAQDLGLIRRVAETEAPAHVRVRVVTASRPLVVGLSALVGVETFLGAEPPLRPIEVEKSAVGTSDYLLGPAALDPRLGGGDAFGAPDDFS